MRVFRVELEGSVADRGMLRCSRGQTAVVAGRLLGADVQRHELASRARPEQTSSSRAVSSSWVVGKGKRFVALALVIIIIVVAVAALRLALAVLSCA